MLVERRFAIMAASQGSSSRGCRPQRQTLRTGGNHGSTFGAALCLKPDRPTDEPLSSSRHSIYRGAGMWLTIVGAIAALIVVAAVVATVAIRGLRRFVRTLWPHS